MTTCNGAGHLLAQLESFSAQTRLPDELVVRDDQSTDDTWEMLQDFADRAPFPLQIRRNEARIGFTANFSRVLSECSGDIVFLSDQDDVWYPDKIASVSRAFDEDSSVHLIIHDAELVDEYLRASGTTYLQQVLRGYGTSRSLATGAMTAVRRELLGYALPVPEGIVGHDIWLHSIADMLDARKVVNENLQAIRRHSSNTSAWVASSLKPISRLDVWRSQSRTKVASDYSDRALLNIKTAETLMKIRDSGAAYSAAAIATSLDQLAKERAAITHRSELAKASWARQKMICLTMLVNGEYGFFNGYRSFFRDLAR
jgi:glycosyltransferase involved in cell wall biosynthesis